MRFLYVYLMKDDPDRVRAVAPVHAAYWQGLRLGGYLGGPFADRSGGTITFEAGSMAEAERLVADDPFAREDILESPWVKQWTVEETRENVALNVTTRSTCCEWPTGRPGASLTCS
jgi:uncharacterized protein YciI